MIPNFVGEICNLLFRFGLSWVDVEEPGFSSEAAKIKK
jgi:hypothetical protein